MSTLRKTYSPKLRRHPIAWQIGGSEDLIKRNQIYDQPVEDLGGEKNTSDQDG